ncbi:MAG: hypothetical protein ACJZ6B_06885 [Actinomycetes bacterium]
MPTLEVHYVLSDEDDHKPAVPIASLPDYWRWLNRIRRGMYPDADR